MDAKDKVLGRLAVQVAQLLMGKHKPLPYKGFDNGDYVVVTNAKEIVVTGKKDEQKLYRHHTGYPGGLKEIPYKRLLERKPEDVRTFYINLLYF